MADSREDRIAYIRAFNRFYTRRTGVLREGLLHSPYSLAEARIIWELGHRERPTASELVRELGLDAGYVSRILARFEREGLVARERSEKDGRQLLLGLTDNGKDAFALLDRRSRDEVAELLDELSEEEQERLIRAMETIESVLQKGLKFAGPFFLRPHEPGDMGWVVHRHGVLYAQEYGWDERFEALVAGIVSDFVNHLKPGKERCWIAEMNGEIVGCVFVVQAAETVAKLRLLLVEPKARGLGLGTRLVRECIRFAGKAGYEKMVLWTNSVLVEARRIYEREGFKLIAEEAHHSFGHDLVGETWELAL